MEDQKVSWKFVQEHILVRLTDLEEEVRLLREVCWPVCQALIEPNQISCIQRKREFLTGGGSRDLDELKRLLGLKSQMYNALQKQGGGLLREEITRVLPGVISKNDIRQSVEK